MSNMLPAMTFVLAVICRYVGGRERDVFMVLLQHADLVIILDCCMTGWRSWTSRR